MKKKKIISLLWGYNSGGVTEYVKNISKIHDSSEFHIKTVIIQKRNWGTDFSVFKGVDYETIYFNNVFSFTWLYDLIKLLKYDTPTFIFAHSFNAAIIAAFVKKIFYNIPLVCSYHGVYIAPTIVRKPLALFYNGLSFFIYKHFASGVVCVSDFSKKELVSKGVNNKKIEVIYNGISEIPKFSNKLIDTFHDTNNILIIGVICRLVPLKGIDILIKAVRNIPNVKLLVIGDGPMRNALEEEANDIIDNVLFLGNQNNVPDWLEIIDIFVLPSFVENHSIAILEAMRQGKGIITTDIGGNPESIRNNIDGILVKAGDLGELTKAIEYVQKNPEKINQFGESAQKRFLSNFTKKIMYEKIYQYFQKLSNEVKND